VQGTTVTVTDLFYNVPARRKFLKKSETEYLHILDLFISFAMFHTGVSWKLTHNDNLIYQVHKTDDWSERVGQLIGREVIKDLIPLNVEASISLVGFIGKPTLAKPNRKSQFLYVNGRLVNDFTTAKAVSQGYGDLLTQGLNPFFIINIIINSADVDVNVHPRKTEVRFANPSEIFRQVQSAVRGTLNANNVLNASPIKQDVQPNNYHPVNREGFIFEPDSMNTSTNFFQSRSSDYQGAFRNLNFAKSVATAGYQQSEQEKLGDWRLIGQIHKSYLLVENDAGFLVIDQHAAAERINYERLKRELESTTPHSQKLLIPQKIELSVRQVQMIDNVKDVLIKLGFDLEYFGGSTILINAIPHITSHADPVKLVKGILDDLDTEDAAHLHSFEDKQERALKFAACRGAIMFQDKLEPEEQLTLLKQIKELPLDKQTCCHGRPFMKQFLKSDLEKLFHRL
jgi:DNA mismatch repair protein MutL